jgi:DNA-binding transcriptional ArsR family regulator
MFFFVDTAKLNSFNDNTMQAQEIREQLYPWIIKKGHTDFSPEEFKEIDKSTLSVLIYMEKVSITGERGERRFPNQIMNTSFLADRTGYTIRAMQYAIKKLRERGIIKIKIGEDDYEPDTKRSVSPADTPKPTQHTARNT